MPNRPTETTAAETEFPPGKTPKGTPESPPALLQQILTGDIPSSLVVFLIAIPLSLGIALASGAPVMAGLIAGVVGGIVAGSLGGSQLQVSGPAAGLTVIVFGLIQQFGWAATCAITVLAGLLQILFGVTKIARGALAISPAVVHGMLAGIGVTIALQQIHTVLGGAPGHSALENIRELPEQIRDLHGGATFLGLITLGLLFAWKYLPPSVRRVPGPLAAVTVGTLLSVFTPLGQGVERVDLPNKLFEEHVFPQWPTGDFGAIAMAALSIALIASVESLLSAIAVDKQHSGPRANLDRELIGQGAANTLSGLLGGLPVTGVIVRSSANVAAGAKTRASAILHGVWILLFVALLGHIIEEIPKAVLAGLLVYVGVQLVKPADIRELAHHREHFVYGATLAGVVFLHLLYGVGIGIAVALFLLLRRIAQLKVSTEQGREGRWHVTVEGSLTFLSVPILSKSLDAIPSKSAVDIDLHVDFMDHAAFEALHNWRLGHERTGGSVDIDETHERWYAPAVAGHPRQAKTTGLGGLANLFRGRRKGPDGKVVPTAADASNQPGETPLPVVDGARAFQRSGADLVRPVLAELAEKGQKPHDLFIACSDSRVVPTVFTLSGPGDLFKIRNIGNLIPPFSPDDPTKTAEPSVAAAIDFALDVLNVPGIVICGHSGCGAMKAILDGSELPDQPNLASWLENGRASLARFNCGEVPDPSLAPYDQLSQVNVMQQIDHLLAYPKVRERVAAGQLSVVGMYFDIEHAQVYLLDPALGRFMPVTEDEAAKASSVGPLPLSLLMTSG